MEGQDAREVEDAGWRKDRWREVRLAGSGQSEETLIQMAFSIFELRPAASGQSRRQLKESERERGEQRREECNLTNELRAVAPPPPVRSFGSMSRGHRSMMTAWPAPPPVPPPATTGAMQRTTLLTPRRRRRHIQVSDVPEHSIFFTRLVEPSPPLILKSQP